MNRSAHSPQRLALDLQKALQELSAERGRVQQLLEEIDRQNAELDRLRNSVRRESNSRLLAEEALDESRERLELAVEAAELALWDWSMDSGQLFMTARWGEMIGDVVMDGYWDVTTLMHRIHPDDRARVEAASQQLKQAAAQRMTTEYRVRRGDDWIWVENHAMVAEYDEHGRARRLMGTLADISRRKLVEAQSEQARLQAIQANRAKTEFLANMSHEIRTPLNALMGLTQLLMESPLNGEQRQWLSLMDTSAHTLLNMLNDVLDLSRIEAGKMEVERVSFDLSRLLDSTAAMYENQARLRSIQWTVAIATDLPRQVWGDPGRLGQVLGNLLSNAVKFTPRGGRVRLSAMHQADPSGAPLLRLQVQDSGVGIAPRHQARIFEAFTQADSSTARRYGGSGLGLTICSRLVQLMGGRIDLESELGKGSTFTVTLPLLVDGSVPVDTAGSQKQDDEATAIERAAGRFAGLQVLLAEDNPVNELLMSHWLERLGCIVHVARDGQEALDEWKSVPVALILMDVQMPRMSGLEATEHIRELERVQGGNRTPIVAVTANAMNGDRQICNDAGMDAYVSKPVSPTALIAAMADALGRCAPRFAEASSHEAQAVARPALVGPMDLNKLRRRLDGDEPSFQQLARAMRDDLCMRVSQLQQALIRRDKSLAVSHAHGLKGSLGSMTAERGARLAKGLELAARSGDWVLFGRALPLLQAEAQQIDAALSAVITPSGADG
jgi:signal transduction histidine kinase/DNA-binding response OmpR family regulator